jgi:hypothetical protein
MKPTINRVMFAVAASLGLASLSSAQTTVYITGSTAMRGNVYNALIAPGVIFQSAPTNQTFYDDGSPSNPSKANWMGFIGVATAANGGGVLTLKCHWSGSEAGVHDVASSLAEDFIPDGQMNNSDNGTAVPTAPFDHSTVDIAMADNAQTFSLYSVKKGFTNVKTNAGVGVITFTFVRNPGVWTGTNISSSQFRQAENVSTLATCPLAVFSGNAADTTTFVYISGRDNQSGTRVNTFGDTGYGIFAAANQIEMDSSGNMQQVPPLSGNYLGDFGFSSGGTLAGTMGANTTATTDQITGATGFSVVAYLSRGDANTAIGKGAVELNYNGVQQSTANVLEGKHTLWGNEFILQRNGASVAAQKVWLSLAPTASGFGTGGNGIDSQIASPPSAGASAIRFGDMHCTRTGPTTDPAHN